MNEVSQGKKKEAEEVSSGRKEGKKINEGRIERRKADKKGKQ